MAKAQESQSSETRDGLDETDLPGDGTYFQIVPCPSASGSIAPVATDPDGAYPGQFAPLACYRPSVPRIEFDDRGSM